MSRVVVGVGCGVCSDARSDFGERAEGDGDEPARCEGFEEETRDG